MQGSLEAKIESNGENLSVGERQLLCLARALLRRSRILTLDEASAHIDSETEQRIQVALHQQQKHCTMITIAHRLQTCIESDKILVMGNGKQVEFGTPYELLKNKGSAFSGLVADTGEQNSLRLHELAKLKAKT